MSKDGRLSQEAKAPIVVDGHKGADKPKPTPAVPLECQPCAKRNSPASTSHCVNETDEEHTIKHPKPIRSCPHCRWLRNGPAWQAVAAYTCPITEQLISPIQRAPTALGGLFRIGCSDCASYLKHLGHRHRHRNRESFARFEVTATSSFQRQRFIDHVEGPFHKDALSWKFSESPKTNLIKAAKQEAGGDNVVPGAPPVNNFLWALMLPHGPCSNRQYKSFMQLHSLDSGNAGAIIDRGHHTVAKMHGSAGAYLHNKHVDLVSKSVRLSFAFDDMDQINILRCRVTYMTPRVGTCEFVAPAVMDFGVEVEDNEKAVKTSLQRLCQKITGKQSRVGPIVHEPVDMVRWRHMSDVVNIAISNVGLVLRQDKEVVEVLFPIILI